MEPRLGGELQHTWHYCVCATWWAGGPAGDSSCTRNSPICPPHRDGGVPSVSRYHRILVDCPGSTVCKKITKLNACNVLKVTEDDKT